MAICKFCGKEMSGASSCIESEIRIEGKSYAPVPYKKRIFEKDQPRCPVCNVMPGGFHHVGCEMEICPRCGNRWVFCRCSGTKFKIDKTPPKKDNVIFLADKLKSRAKTTKQR